MQIRAADGQDSLNVQQMAAQSDLESRQLGKGSLWLDYSFCLCTDPVNKKPYYNSTRKQPLHYRNENHTLNKTLIQL